MKSTITRRLFALLLLSLGTHHASQAQPGPMEYLGEANVDGGRDHDEIRVTRARGAFRAIQLRVERSAIRFDRVIVHYGNGSSEPLFIRAVIPAEQATRLIDLPGGQRLIRSVEFYYERARFNGRRPKVRLFGVR